MRSPNRTRRVSDSRPSAYSRMLASCKTGEPGDHSGALTSPNRKVTDAPPAGTGSIVRSPRTSTIAVTVGYRPAAGPVAVTSTVRSSGSAFTQQSRIRAGPWRSSQTLCQMPP